MARLHLKGVAMWRAGAAEKWRQKKFPRNLYTEPRVEKAASARHHSQVQVGVGLVKEK